MPQTNRDVVVTWPKTKALEKYLEELEKALIDNLLINYRVRYPPNPIPERCYLVHDGVIVGWNRVTGVKYRYAGEVLRVGSDRISSPWPEGWYIIRRPQFHKPELEGVKMKGFRGWRWFDREMVND